MTNTSAFWEAIKNVKIPEKVEIEYRAYHEGTKPLFTISNPVTEPWPEGDFIVITRQQYNEFRPSYCKIIGGKLIEMAPVDINKIQLERDPSGKYVSLVDDIIFAALEGDNYQKKSTNDPDQQ